MATRPVKHVLSNLQSGVLFSVGGLDREGGYDRRFRAQRMFEL